MSNLTKLGKYEIRRELGKGGMGTVYEGFDPDIERIVAIKAILKSSVDSAEARDVFNRFRREARAAGRLTHPKIVSIYEYGEDEDRAYIAMELIHGKELKDSFDNGERFQIKESVGIMLQLLDALAYSHSRGVVHRDIKPANILITGNGEIKVADFGIAKIDSSHLTKVGAVLGTPTYMSPEQFTGLAVDHRSDIYSAGVILYQLLTGLRPFTGSVITIMHKVLNQEAAPPSSLNPKVSQELDAVVRKAMAKRPEDRFQSATEFMEALKAAVVVTLYDAAATMNPETTLVATDGLLAPVAADMQVDATVAPVTPLQADVGFWKGIRDSANADDFRLYLKEYPDGEFSELARLRIAALQAADAQTRKVEEQAHRETRLAGAKAVAGAMLQRDADARVLLEMKLAEIRAKAAEDKAREDAKRKLDEEERFRRAKGLAEMAANRSRKMAEIIAEREAERAAEADMEAEDKRKLEAEIKRRKETKK
jgi:serine/threonine-protein kinase